MKGTKNTKQSNVVSPVISANGRGTSEFDSVTFES